MPTSQADNSTRSKLLDAAEGLMLSRGYVGASVDSICKEAALTKGSFFHHFKNKEELGKVLLERYAERQESAFVAACEGVADPLERVYRIIDVAVTAAKDPGMNGCLVGAFAQEISETHPELRSVCRECFEKFATSMSADLAAAKELHCPDAAFDPSGLGAYILSVVQGSLLILRANEDRSVMARNLLHLRSHLEALYGR